MSTWGWVCVVLGVICGLAGLLLLVLDQMRYKKATGKVVGNAGNLGPFIEMYAPTLQFKTEDGKTRTFQSWSFFSATVYSIGEEMPVRYHPTITKLNGINRLLSRMYGVVVFVYFALMLIWLGVEI